MNGTQEPKVVQVASPEQLLNAVPGLIGFTPAESLVVVGVEGPRHRVKVTLRYDLPGADDIRAAEQIVGHATSVLTQAGVDTMVAVVYGADEPGGLVAAALAAQDDVDVRDVLRVADGRYWSYACTGEDCCPAAGTPFEAQIPEEFGTVLADRARLADRVAPVTGERAEAMRQVTRAAEQRAGDAVAVGGQVRFVNDALTYVQAAIAVYRNDAGLASDSDAAIMLVGLCDLRVRDDAWSRMEPEFREAHLRLWTDLTTLAPAGLVAAPASLLAFVAWQSGNGALANVALDRALADDPSYSMAQLLRQVITAGAPPSLARLPMTPEEVAESYADQS